MVKLVLATAIALLSTASVAACTHLYPRQQPITIPNTTELCNSFFVVLYDVNNKAAMLASEIVSSSRHKVRRDDSFRADLRIPPQHRVRPADYVKTGYDKGHVIPAGDATNTAEMAETFLMTNMTPQEPTLNRAAWRELEMMIRARVQRSGKNTTVLTVITYPTFPKKVGSGVPVPNAYYKIAFFASGVRVYYAPNTPNAPVTELSVSVIKQMSGSPLAVYLP